MESVPRPKTTLPQAVTYKKEDLKILLEAASHSESVYLEILLAMFLGLRTGEILGLKFSDFDFGEHTVDIRRQITQEFEVEILEDGSRHVTRKEMREKVPRSLDSVRCLRVPDFLLEEVKKRQALQNKMLGHKSVATTLDIYCGIISGMEDIRTYVSGNLDPVRVCLPKKEVV